MRTFPISRMIEKFGNPGGVSAIETAIDCFELPDGRIVQLTVKLETDEREWLSMAPDVRQAIKDRDARGEIVR